MLRTLLLLFLFPISIFTQSLSGKVYGKINQDPLVGATILVLDNGKFYGAVSNESGEFSLKLPESKSYMVKVNYLGYQKIEQNIEVNGEVMLDFIMEEADTSFVTFCDEMSCKEPTVEAPRLSTYLDAQADAYTFSVLSANDLKHRQIYQDLPVALATTPSISTYSENGNGMGYSTLRMRGFDQRRVAVSINGIPQNEPEDHNVYWVNFYDIQQIASQIQLQRGASGAFYGGNGIAGAVNIIAHPYEYKKQMEVALGYGHYNTQRYAISYNTGLKNGWIGFARLAHARSDGYRKGSWTKFYRFFAGITHYSEKSTFILQTWGGPQQDGLAYTGISKLANQDAQQRRENIAALTNDQEYFHQPHLEAIYDYKIAPNTSLNFKAYAVKGKGYFDYGATWRTGAFFRLPNLSTTDLQKPLYELYPNISLTQRAALMQHRLGGSAEIQHKNNLMGIDFRQNNSLRWGRIQDATAEIPQQLVGDNDVRVYSAKGKKTTLGLYGKWKHDWKKGITKHHLQADFRAAFNAYHVYDESFFNNNFRVSYLSFHPRIAYSYWYDEDEQIYASLAYTSREPRLQDLYNVEEAGAGATPQFRHTGFGIDYTSPLIHPEHVINPELGWKYESGERFWNANVYYMRFKDEIVPSGGIDVYGNPRIGNAPSSVHYGIETDFKFRLNRYHRFALGGNATIAKHQYLKFTEYEPTPQIRDGNNIALMPQMQGNLNISYKKEVSYNHFFEAILSGQFVGKQYVNNANGKNANGSENPNLTTPAYGILNANVNYTLPNGLTLSLDLNNLLNQNILTFGNQAFIGAEPQFFPLAKFNSFFSIKVKR